MNGSPGRHLVTLGLLLGACAGPSGEPWFFVDAGGGADGSVGSDADYTRSGETAAADGTFGGCLDGTDGDSDRSIDCADSECGAAPVCCVGSTSAPCCSAITDLATALSACGSTCSGIATTAFGAARVDVEGFHPTHADADDGFVLDLPLDARAGTLTLRATVRAPSSGRQLDLVTFGFTASDDIGTRVLPLVALQVNAGTRQVVLLVGESVADHAALMAEDTTEYAVELAPDGTVTVSGGASLSARGVPPLGLLRPVIYGRTDDAAASASIETLTVVHRACDVPSALDPVAVTLVDEAASFIPQTEANPSLARDAMGRRFLAFDALRVDEPTRRGVFIAEETSPLRFVVRNPSATELQPVIASIDVEEFVDPELLVEGGRWVLYAAGEANGARSIFRAESSEGLAFGAPMELMIAGDHGSLDSPAPFPGHPERLLARETDDAGATRIVELRFPVAAGVDQNGAFGDAICGVDDICESTSSRDTRYILTARGDVSFDADEVDAPSMVSERGVYRLYYAGRRGNRWATGLVVSEDGSYWRRISETARASDVVLGPEAVLAPLGARNASVTLEGRTLTLVFEGYRGTRSAILIAQQTL